MKSSQAIAPQLNRWFAKNARDLPWRKTRDPYKIWVSEVMLQQTTVATVISYYDRWVKEYPTIHHVAKAPVSQILKMWQGLGYYNRARNLHQAAKLIVKKYGGKIPDDYQTLRQIPGFGPYTTGAVLSIAFDKRFAIVDANIRRVIMRLQAIKREANAKWDEEIYSILKGILPQKNLRTFNQALMELGALVCKSSEPVCVMCPLKKNCKAYELGIQELIPVRVEKQTEEINVAVGVLKRGGKYFIQQRSSKGLLADLWEFPGGKVEKGEKPEEALVRELKEELNIKVGSRKYLTTVKHFYTKYKVNLSAFECAFSEELSLNQSRKWVSLKEFEKYPMPSGSAKIVDFLQNNI